MMQEVALLYWHWLLIGLGLLVLEMFAPGVIFLWMGLAAGSVGVLLYVDPAISWTTQLFVFAVLSVVYVVLGRWWLSKRPLTTDQPRLNRRAEQYIGREFTLAEDMENGRGKIQVDDSTWKVTGDDFAAGTRIRVVDVDGVLLVVERVSE